MAAPRRTLLSGLLVLLVSLAGAVLFRRRHSVRGERADLYLGDGSMITLAAGDAAAEELLGIARTLLQEARA